MEATGSSSSNPANFSSTTKLPRRNAKCRHPKATFEAVSSSVCSSGPLHGSSIGRESTLLGCGFDTPMIVKFSEARSRILGVEKKISEGGFAAQGADVRPRIGTRTRPLKAHSSDLTAPVVTITRVADRRGFVMGNSGSSSSSNSRLSSRYESSSSRLPPPPQSSRYSSSYYEEPQRQSSPPYQQQQQYSPPPPKKTLQRRRSHKYAQINDNYSSVQEVQQALGASGLESSNLIVGIDFTKSNEWTGKHSFGGRSLHAIGSEPNPYEKAIAIIGKTLSTFDDDNLIPCFGFGDSTTHDKHVFSFNSDHRPCEGFEEALSRYRTIVPHLRLAGPTSFAPIINAAVDIVEESGGQYHVLIIIADGQVTRSVDVADGQQSPQEQATVEAIVNASSYPLSIVLVGVGDGPWDTMKEFDDNLPHRSFDNFQFVNFTHIMQQNLQPQRKEASFALAALMEIPEQYKATLELGMLSKTVGRSPGIKPLLPPPKVLQRDGYQQQPRSGYQPPGYPQQQPAYQQKPSFNNAGSQNYSRPRDPYQQQPGYGGGYDYNYNYPPPSAPTITRAAPDEPTTDCPVCLTDKKDLAFNCGHQTCRQCADSLQACPICREPITTRIRLY